MMGELRNYPFKPDERDLQLIRAQLADYSDTPVRIWALGHR